jgi:CubicO group peptidase (beta-lactamase class C family)
LTRVEVVHRSPRIRNCDEPSDGPPGCTAFYLAVKDGVFEPGPPFDPSHKLPGAGYLATAGDLARFGAALLHPGLLGETSREEMFRAVPLLDGTPTEFALGLRRGHDGKRVILHQPGGGIGISCWLFLYPEEKLVIAVMSNLSTAPVGGPVYTEIEAAFLEAIGRRNMSCCPGESAVRFWPAGMDRVSRFLSGRSLACPESSP